MKFGVVLPTYGNDATYPDILATAQTAENLGFDSIWVTDHLALPQEDAERFGHIFEAVSTLSWLAAKTNHIRLGISALVLPQRHPVEVAKSLATIDHFSDGRLILATGIGWSSGEYSNLSQDFRNRAQRMNEALTILRRLWSTPYPVSFEGKYYQFKQIILSPPPAQPGGIPIWVAGDSPAAVKRAVKYGDGWHPNAKPAAEIKAALKIFQTELQERKFEVCMRMRIAFTAEPVPNQVLSGSPQQMLQVLHEYQNSGVTSVILYFPSETQRGREQAMQTFHKEVISRFIGD